MPKVLFLDIEATNLSASMGYLLCVGLKWAHERKPRVFRVDETYEWKKDKTDDTGLLNAIEPYILEADVVVHHFGDIYDLPFIQTRRLMKGFGPLPDVATVDTWRIARKKLKFHSNRLDAIINSLGCPFQKTPVLWDGWMKAMAGDTKAINYVVEHCRQDILSLEWVYNKLKAFWPHHPTMISWEEKGRLCPLCAKQSGVKRGTRRCASRIFARINCKNCGRWWKGEEIKHEYK